MEGESRMKEKGILIRADYGHIALHLREIMEERDITRNQLAKRIDARFEVVNKWYQGELEKRIWISSRVSAMHWTAQQRIYWNTYRRSLAKSK